MLKNHEKVATPKIEYRKNFICVLASMRFFLNGNTTSCIKTLPHECRYVSFVETAAAMQTATKRPIKPVGKMNETAKGVVCCI